LGDTKTIRPFALKGHGSIAHSALAAVTGCGSNCLILLYLSGEASPGRGHCIMLLGKTQVYPSVPLSTQAPKWIPRNIMLGGNPLDYHPIHGIVEILPGQ